MGSQVPGPLCSTRVGDTWIDGGTTCRSRSSTPGSTGLELIGSIIKNLDPAKSKFDQDHVYSQAPEATRKRDIDLQIIGDDYSRSAEIRLDNERYLKELIRLGSGGRQTVGARGKGIQFFIIRGGAEGFLDASMAKADAGNFQYPSTSTNGKTSAGDLFDLNDLLVVFNPGGKLIRAALLQRPLSLPDRPKGWTEATANAIYDAWDNKEVSIYRNENFDVPYLGLHVDDGTKRGWVDMHKQEATDGCILIVDPGTPALGTKQLNTFEPKLILDVLSAVGKKPEQVKGTIPLGIMHVVTIK